MLQVRCWALGWQVDNAAGVISALLCKFCCWYRNKIYVDDVRSASSFTNYESSIKIWIKTLFLDTTFIRNYGSL